MVILRVKTGSVKYKVVVGENALVKDVMQEAEAVYRRLYCNLETSSAMITKIQDVEGFDLDPSYKLSELSIDSNSEVVASFRSFSVDCEHEMSVPEHDFDHRQLCAVDRTTSHTSSLLDGAESYLREAVPEGRQLANSRRKAKMFHCVTLKSYLGKTRKSRACISRRCAINTLRSTLKRRRVCQRIIARDQRKEERQTRATTQCGDFVARERSPCSTHRDHGELTRSKEGPKLLVSVALGDAVSVKSDSEKQSEIDDWSENSSCVGLLDDLPSVHGDLLCEEKEKERVLDGSIDTEPPLQRKTEYLSRHCSDLSTELAEKWLRERYTEAVDKYVVCTEVYNCYWQMGFDNKQKTMSRAELDSLVEREFPNCSVGLHRFGKSEVKSVYLGVTERKPPTAVARSDDTAGVAEGAVFTTRPYCQNRLLVSILLDRVKLAQQEKDERESQYSTSRIAELSFSDLETNVSFSPISNKSRHVGADVVSDDGTSSEDNVDMVEERSCRQRRGSNNSLLDMAKEQKKRDGTVGTDWCSSSIYTRASETSRWPLKLNHASTMKPFVQRLASEHVRVDSPYATTAEAQLGVVRRYTNLDSSVLSEKLRQVVAGGAASLPTLIDDNDHWQ